MNYVDIVDWVLLILIAGAYILSKTMHEVQKKAKADKLLVVFIFLFVLFHFTKRIIAL